MSEFEPDYSRPVVDLVEYGSEHSRHLVDVALRVGPAAAAAVAVRCGRGGGFVLPQHLPV